MLIQFSVLLVLAAGATALGGELPFNHELAAKIHLMEAQAKALEGKKRPVAEAAEVRASDSQTLFACQSLSKKTNVFIEKRGDKAFISANQDAGPGMPQRVLFDPFGDEVTVRTAEIWPSNTTVKTVKRIPGFRAGAELMHLDENDDGISGFVRYLKDGTLRQTPITCKRPIE